VVELIGFRHYLFSLYFNQYNREFTLLRWCGAAAEGEAMDMAYRYGYLEQGLVREMRKDQIGWMAELIGHEVKDVKIKDARNSSSSTTYRRYSLGRN